MPSISTIIANIDESINTLVQDFDSIIDYQMGDKKVEKTKALDMLLKARQYYRDMEEKTPYEDIKHIAYDFGDFGQDESEYIGDEE